MYLRHKFTEPRKGHRRKKEIKKNLCHGIILVNCEDIMLNQKFEKNGLGSLWFPSLQS